MAYDKLVDSVALDNGLTLIADAIREKGETTESLAFPYGMKEAVLNIETGIEINGVQNQYLATADINKGDFVQLTTKGVEEAAFTSAGTLNIEFTSDNNRLSQYVSAAVLSPTQFVVAYVARNAALTSSVAAPIYAQVYTYSNGTWTAGTPLLIETINDGSYSNIAICRLSHTRAAITYLNEEYANSRVFILDIDENINVTASTSGVSKFTTGVAPIRLTPLTDNTFVAHVYVSTGYIYHWVVSYTDGTITLNNVGLSGNNDGTSYFYSCKLNDQTILMLAAGETYFELLTVDSGTGTLVSSTLKHGATSVASPHLVRDGELVYLSENKVLSVVTSDAVTIDGAVDTQSLIYEYSILSYDPDTSTLTRERFVGEDAAKGEYYSFDAHKMSDSEVIVMTSDVSDPDASTDALYMMVVNVETGTYGGRVLSPINALGKYKNWPITYSGYGWLVAFSSITSVLVAPLVSQTTAAPYATRIDGVANNSVSAGQTAEVIVPQEV